jgi:hypothetical protein
MEEAHMTMLWITLGLGAAAAGAGYVAYTQIKRAGRLARTIREKNEAIGAYKAELKERDHIIKRMEEAADEADEQKSEIRSGSDSDKFRASKRILSDDTDGSAPD